MAESTSQNIRPKEIRPKEIRPGEIQWGLSHGLLLWSVSAAVLAYEILLMRMLSIGQEAGYFL